MMDVMLDDPFWLKFCTLPDNVCSGKRQRRYGKLTPGSSFPDCKELKPLQFQGLLGSQLEVNAWNPAFLLLLFWCAAWLEDRSWGQKLELGMFQSWKVTFLEVLPSASHRWENGGSFQSFHTQGMLWEVSASLAWPLFTQKAARKRWFQWRTWCREGSVQGVIPLMRAHEPAVMPRRLKRIVAGKVPIMIVLDLVLKERYWVCPGQTILFQPGSACTAACRCRWSQMR